MYKLTCNFINILSSCCLSVALAMGIKRVYTNNTRKQKNPNVLRRRKKSVEMNLRRKRNVENG